MRRGILQVQVGLLLVWCSTLEAFDFQDVRAEAETLSRRPYASHTNRVPEAFRRMVTKAGFVRAGAEPMLGGLVTIHSGWKI